MIGWGFVGQQIVRKSNSGALDSENTTDFSHN